VAIHPGVVNTNLATTWAEGNFVFSTMKALITPFILKSPKEGAINQLWAATGKKAKGEGGDGVRSGVLYTPVSVEGGGSRNAMDGELAGRLWEWTEKELECFEAS